MFSQHYPYSALPRLWWLYHLLDLVHLSVSLSLLVVVNITFYFIYLCDMPFLLPPKV